ncbi:hypothetical protein Tco_0317297 [Tanacetum coccineum]
MLKDELKMKTLARRVKRGMRSRPLTSAISRIQSQTEPQTDSSHGAANAHFTFFTPASDEVTGHLCSEMAAKYAEADPRQIPPKYKELYARNMSSRSTSVLPHEMDEET